jgi:hypothetical protein
MSDTEQKPKAVRPPMSDEQKAKMKAGREAAKARKDAEKAAGAAAPAPVPAPAEAEAAPAPAPEPVPEQPKKKPGRKPKAPKANGGAGAEPEAETDSAPETPKKEKKAPGAPKKEKKAKVAETAPENKTETVQNIISFVMNLKNDNWDEGDDYSEKWFQDRTYFASSDSLRRYLTDRIYNWTDDFAVMFRALADDSKTEINKMIETIVSTPFLANHEFNEPRFNVSRCNITIHQ